MERAGILRDRPVRSKSTAVGQWAAPGASSKKQLLLTQRRAGWEIRALQSCYCGCHCGKHWRFLSQTQLMSDPDTHPFWGIFTYCCPEVYLREQLESHVYMKIYSWMFVVATSFKPKEERTPVLLTHDGWVNKIWYVHIREYYPAIKSSRCWYVFIVEAKHQCPRIAWFCFYEIPE